MKPRDRVAMTLNHEDPDHCPLPINFTPEFAARLRQDMKIVHKPHGGGNMYELEQILGKDLLLTSAG